MRTTFKMDCFLALFGGVALVFAFSPMHVVWLAVIAPAVLYSVLSKHNAYRALQLGFIFGFGFFAVGVSWVFISIYFFGGASFWSAALLTLLFVCVLASLFALMGFSLQRYFPTNNVTKILLVYPALWALFEALRGWLLTGFPWLMIGQSVTASVFSGLAPIFGAYGTAFWLVFVGGLFYIASVPNYGQSKLHGWQLSNLALIALVVFFGGVYGLSMIHWSTAVSHPLRVSLVQGNIPQGLRWDEKQVRHILDTYQSLTESHDQSDLIVWPEGAIPLPVNLHALELDAVSYRGARNLKLIPVDYFIQQMNEDLAANHSGLITGIPYEDGQFAYNAVLGLGAAQGIYFKRHLVPFGEYVPFEKYLRGLIQFFNLPMSHFSKASLHQPLMIVNGVPIGVYLCYEVAYSGVVRADLPQAALLLTLSDDAWFGHSLAPWQHLQIGQFAALASGRPMLFVGDNGVTAIINAQGQLQSVLPQFTENVLDGTISAYEGTTPWVRLGDLPYLILMLIVLAVCYSKPKYRNEHLAHISQVVLKNI